MGNSHILPFFMLLIYFFSFPLNAGNEHMATFDIDETDYHETDKNKKRGKSRKSIRKEILCGSYGSFFTSGPAFVQPGEIIPINVKGVATKNIQSLKGQIVVSEPGIYFVHYGVSVLADGAAGRVGLIINDVLQPNTSINLLEASQMGSASTILRVISKPTQISMVNLGTTEILLSPSYPNDVSVFLTLVKLHHFRKS